MWQDSLKPALRRWMVGTLIALAYAAMTGSCTPQPAANRVLVQTEPATAGRPRSNAMGSGLQPHERPRTDERHRV